MRQPEQMIPSLEIYVPVINVGDEQVADLSAKLVKLRSSPSPKDIRRILKPAESPRANITFPEELANIHQYMGFEKMEPEHLDNLMSFMRSVLEVHFESEGEAFSREVPTLPASLDEVSGGLLLSVARSEEIKEARLVAKAAFGAYYRLKSIPSEVWTGVDDDLLTGVHIAESPGPSSNDLVRQLYVEVNSDDSLLPQQTEMGGLKVVEFRPTR